MGSIHDGKVSTLLVSISNCTVSSSVVGSVWTLESFGAGSLVVAGVGGMIVVDCGWSWGIWSRIG